MELNSVKSFLFGLTIGDALGVPVEYKSRDFLTKSPVTGFIGNGTHNQPAGSFSESSSLSLCLVENIVENYNITSLLSLYKDWLYKQYWTANNKTFDVNPNVFLSIKKYKSEPQSKTFGNTSQNGIEIDAIMRIAPLIFILDGKTMEQRYEIVKNFCEITNTDTKSTIACFYYLEFLLGIKNGKNKVDIFVELQDETKKFIRRIDKNVSIEFNWLLENTLPKRKENTINSSKLIVDTLESVIWCFMTTNSFRKAILKAVNLGLNTTVIGSLTGALCGLYYGLNEIPSEWVINLLRHDDIEKLAENLYLKID